ncbi:MAG TPA: fluoride efflux transporter CrcB [Elusimicrobiota bacterium]|nr:fluoride efflux transporter CrcB [Elusimicrobiota bacterium]
MEKYLCLALGSLLGGFSRYQLGGFVYRFWGADFPYGTMVVNLCGCLLVGFFNSLAEVKFVLGTNSRILLMTGFCGAFTTFSTFILESSNLLKDGEWLKVVLNVGGSVVFGYLLFRVGAWIGEFV